MSITRCPHCGTANRAGSNFCNGCGTDLRNPDARPEPAETPSPAPPESPPATAAEAQPEKPKRVRAKAARPPRPAPTPPEAPPVEPPFGGQPWLRLEFDAGEPAEETISADAVEDSDEGEARLVSGVQGLLAPIRVATNIGDDDPVFPAVAPVLPTTDLSAEQIRLIRTLMAEAPAPGAAPAPRRRLPRLRVGWVFLLLALAIGLPALLFLGGPHGIPMHWPGVDEAFAAIQALPPDALVVVNWAYDPATGDELNLAMRPVMEHLLQRRVRLAVVSTLPGGPATARRLIAQARSDAVRPSALVLAGESSWPVTYSYLPGGAAVLALAARDPVAALLEDPARVVEATRHSVERPPSLVVVAAAQAEDAQMWLEQVQPLDHTPVVVVTGAGADPILRPYLDSGQVRGLVSGFDGGYSYQQLLEPFTAHTSPSWLGSQVILQNWGHLALIVIIVLGNLAALLGRGGSE